MKRVDRELKLTSEASHDGVDRRGFLRCMAWAGTGLLWTVQGGVPVSKLIAGTRGETGGDFSFVQISDSHIGFDKAANPDVTKTLQVAIDRINALKRRPDLILHTGDLSHLSKPSEFDTLDQALKSLQTRDVFYVPGEHDVATDNGEQYRQRYGKGTLGAGWHSFDHRGVHFVGLVNVVDLKASGLGQLGAEQLAWLQKDLADRSNSTPVVVFAHIPLWTVYPDWGWGTQDGAQVLAQLKRFGSVTVLNGHIHQVMQKVEGNVVFHTAMATAFPQPVPGTAHAAGPLKVPAEELHKVLGIASVHYIASANHLAVVDSPLAGTPPHEAEAILRKAAAALPATQAAQSQQLAASGESVQASIDNFDFNPKTLTIKTGTSVEWTNRDDTPHTITSNSGVFGSKILDTEQKFKFVFASAGHFPYHCKLHPTMTGEVVVQ